MNRCEQCQDLMLEHLYDLLEEPERLAFLEHLGQCSTCQAKLEQARRQQQLLTTASRKQFPEVHFEAPARVTVPQPVAPLVVTKPHSRVLQVARWAVAAGVLIAAIGFALPAAHHWSEYSSARSVVTEHQMTLAENNREINEARRQMVNLHQKKADKENVVHEQVRDQRLKLEVIGPETIQPGAPNEYHIKARNLNDREVPARVDVRVRDQANRVVFEEKNVAFKGEHRLILPRDLPVEPNTILAMEVNARRDGGPESQLHMQLPLIPAVYVTHLTTDKPMYQPGEVVHFRSLTLERFTLKPAEEPFQLAFTITRPTGEEFVVAAGGTHGLTQLGKQAGQVEALMIKGKPIQGIGVGNLYLDPGSTPGGEYTLTVRDQSNRFQPQQRKFIVNRYQPPRMNKELDYARKSYSAGEEVAAVCKAERAEGGAVANRPVEATVMIDGKTFGADGKENNQPFRFQTDNQGKVEVRFKLPAQIEKGEASLSVKFNDGGSIESITRPIPVVTKKLSVEFFPEGGDLVAGVPNRVYFQARSILGKPADLKGRVVDDQGNVVAQAETLTDKDHPGINQGMGVFTFKPQAERKYELKIDSPAGIESKHPLSEIKETGVVLNIPEGVFRSDEPIRVMLHSADQDRSLLVGGYCRGRLLDHQMVKVKKNQPYEMVLKPTVSVGGVYRVTVFEEMPGPGHQRDFVPRAERLVYRKPLQRLEMALHPTKKQHVPGEKATVQISGVTEDDQPTPAIILLAVVDKSVLALADEKTRRSMPAHFYMTSEVRKPDDLEYADFLLTAHPRAKEGLDLLLGTQGWRRFAEQDPEEFKKKYNNEADRLLVSIGQNLSDTPRVAEGEPGPATVKFRTDALETVRQEILKEQAELVTRIQLEQQKYNATGDDPDYKAALAIVADYQKAGRLLRGIGVPVLALSLVIIAAALLVFGIRRGVSRGVVQFVACGACGLLAMGLVGFEFFQVVSEAQRDHRQAKSEYVDLAAVMEMDKRVVENAEMHRMEEKLANEAFPAKPGDFDGKADLRPRAGVALPPQMAPGVADRPDVARALKEEREGGRGKEKAGDAKKGRKDADDQMARKQLEEGREKDKAPIKGDFDGIPRGERGGFGLRPGEAAGGRGPVAWGGNFVVRQYAHAYQPVKGGERHDFTETVCWHPVLVMTDGKMDVQFDLSDAVTTYEIAAMGHTLDGRLGSVVTTIESRLPFTLEPKVPIEVTANDKIYIPLSIANNTNDKRDVNFKVEAKGLKLLEGKEEDRLTLLADQRTRRIFRFQPNIIEGPASLLFEGKTEPFAADKVRRGFVVVPEGFPVAGQKSDMLEGVVVNDIVLPETWVPGTLKVQANVYPSTLASLQKGLESLLREPNGCFEQTSTSNYPNLLILDYLKENDLAKPEIDRRARELLGKGYQKLTSFECQNTSKNKKEGYEWFGGTAPAHEALTAYGLLQFRDMSRVQEVDQAMIERTRQYLMSQRDGNGGFKRNTRALDTFGRAPENITNAYIVWALTESGKDDDLEKELGVLTTQAKASKDPYFVSLVACSLLNRDKSADAVALLKTVAAAQKPDGHLVAEKTSITGSGGQSLQVETTALGMLGWLKANRPADFNVNIQNAVKWIGQQRSGHGGFGSTQSTILALKALIAFTRANKRPAEAGELKMFVGDKEVSKLGFGTESVESLTLPMTEAEKHLKPGKNQVRVEMTGKNVFPYTLAWSYQTLKPASAEGSAVRLTTTLSDIKANEGDLIQLKVRLENISGKGQGMAIAIVGLPAGTNVPENLKQLKDHCLLRDNGTKAGLISAFEIRGRELVLYWRDLAPDQTIEVPIDLDCRVPGEFRGPASRAYLYYNPDIKHWVDPLQMTIQAKAD